MSAHTGGNVRPDLGAIFLNFVLCHTCGGNAADHVHLGGCPENTELMALLRAAAAITPRPLAHDADSVL